ncbi:ABC transporter ATP-binding protein, partial [bacterium]
MLRLGKYFKPYLWQIILTITLLFVQANADLALPDYLSRIVNNGIQAGGVESPLPSYISQTQLERVSLFLSADDQARLSAAYTPITPTDADYAALLEKIPALADQTVYR